MQCRTRPKAVHISSGLRKYIYHPLDIFLTLREVHPVLSLIHISSTEVSADNSDSQVESDNTTDNQSEENYADADVSDSQSEESYTSDSDSSSTTDYAESDDSDSAAVSDLSLIHI